MRLNPYVVIPALLVAIGLTYAVIQATSNTPDMELPPPDYANDSGWAALPQPVPGPVWAEGWAIDVILIGPHQNLAARSPKELAKKTLKGSNQANTLSTNLAAIGPVYAPFYREEAEVDDLARALDIYFDQYNQGRAFMVATNHTLPPQALSRLANDRALGERFGGYLKLTNADALPVEDQKTLCPYGNIECVRSLETTRNDGFLIAIDGQAPALTGPVLDHLKSNVAPLAEPLGALEEIEIIDIRRPGDDVVEETAPAD